MRSLFCVTPVMRIYLMTGDNSFKIGITLCNIMVMNDTDVDRKTIETE